MKNKIKNIILAWCFLALALCDVAMARDMKFEISLDKNKVTIGETVQLGLSFYETQSMPAPDIGTIDGLDIRYIGPSTMMTVINGKVSSSITHMYTVVPLKTKKYQIGPFSFQYKGDAYSSNMVFLEAVEGRVTQGGSGGAVSTEKLNLDDRIFVTLSTGKMSAYINEVVPVTVKLYVNRLNVSDIQLPTFEEEGFMKAPFKEPKQYREEQGNVIYDVLEFDSNIFGTRPGEYKLGPAKIKCNAMVRKRRPGAPSMRDDMFGDEFYKDSFFDDFFSRYERYPVELKSQESTLIVSPLPTEKRPKDFAGTVGDYQFIFDVTPTKVKVGDPITLKMTINGTGNFNTVVMPQIESTEGFKVYEPQVKTEENRKTFTQVLIPEKETITQIPKVNFSYFDPNRKEYRTITQGPIAIQVEKGKEEAPQQVFSGSGAVAAVAETKEPAATRDIIYIKDSPGVLYKKGKQFYSSTWFRIFLLLPLLLICVAHGIQLRRELFARDREYAGRFFARRSYGRGLKRLRQLLRAGEAHPFYETLFKALQDYLGNRLNIPPAGVTADIAENILVPHNVDLDVIRKLKNIFSECDRARFGLLNVDEIKMKDDLKELEEVVRYLEREKL